MPWIYYLHLIIKKEIRHTYISKYNHKRKNLVILLIITDDGERWHYLAVRSMSEEGKNILKYSPGDKSLKVPFIIYADIECLLKKEHSSQNNPKNSCTQRKAKHKPSGYSLSLNCLLVETKNRRKFYRRKDCIKKFCNDLKELVAEIISYKEKEMISLIDKEITLYKSQKVCHICKEKFCYNKNKKSEYTLYHKVRDDCQCTGKFRRAAHNICNLRYRVPKKFL